MQSMVSGLALDVVQLSLNHLEASYNFIVNTKVLRPVLQGISPAPYVILVHLDNVTFSEPHPYHLSMNFDSRPTRFPPLRT